MFNTTFVTQNFSANNHARYQIGFNGPPIRNHAHVVTEYCREAGRVCSNPQECVVDIIIIVSPVVT